MIFPGMRLHYKLVPVNTENTNVAYLTLLLFNYRPVALEGEGSNCFSITQLVGQKRQQ